MKTFLSSTVIIVSTVITLLLPSAALADDSKIFGVCNLNNSTASSAICKDQGTTKDPAIHIIQVATNLIAVLTGIAAVILLIISGLTMITSAGNAEAVASARKRILNVVIGVVIVALAWTIVTFVTDKLIK
jgi:hypothetical protein